MKLHIFSEHKNECVYRSSCDICDGSPLRPCKQMGKIIRKDGREIIL